MKFNIKTTLATILAIAFVSTTAANADVFWYTKKDGSCAEGDAVRSHGTGGFIPQGGWGHCPQKIGASSNLNAVKLTDGTKLPPPIASKAPVKK